MVALASSCTIPARADDADAKARCCGLLRTVSARPGDSLRDGCGSEDVAQVEANIAEGGEPAEVALAGADPQVWTFTDTQGEGDVASQRPKAVHDCGGGLFLSHAWDEPENWSKYFIGQTFQAAKQMQVSTGLRRALARNLARPRVWVDWASFPGAVSGGSPSIEGDHPFENMSFGPYCMPVKALKDPGFLKSTPDQKDSGYTMLHLPEGHAFNGTMQKRKFDEAGRPGQQTEPVEANWQLPPGWYYVQSAHVIAEGFVSPQAAERMDAFTSRHEHILSWCLRLELRDEMWVAFTLGSVRSQCLLLTEPLLVLHDCLVAVAPWNYFDRLWPLCEWALFCAHRGPDRVQLAVDAYIGPSLAEYHRAIQRLCVSKACCRDLRDRTLLLGLLQRSFKCETSLTTVGYRRSEAKLGSAIQAQVMPEQQWEVDYSRVERYVRATAIVLFAREAAVAACWLRSAVGVDCDEDEYGWAGLASELGLSELHEALRQCRPQLWLHGGRDSSVALERLDKWWRDAAMPVLRHELHKAQS